MADYSIQLGVKVDTKGIDTAINKYQGKPIEVKSKLDTSGIDKKIASYKVKKPIEINTKLNTSGLAKKISEYKPKTPIKLNAKLDTNDISTTLRNYKAKTPIKVDIKLDSSDISKQIKAYKAKTPIKVDIKLDSNDITKQIRSYQAKAPIKLNVKLTTKDIDEKIRAYKAKTPIKLDVKINNSAINEQIKSFNPKTTIKLKAALQKGAIADEIRKFKPSAPIKVDLELNYSDIDKKVGEYAAKGGVALPAKLIPASKGFDSGITKKPIEVSATLEPSDINKVIDGFKPTSKVKVDVQLVPKDINTQVTKLQKPTEPLTVDIKLDESSINSSIELFKPTATLGVKPDLILEDVDDQIRAYVPKSKVKVNIELNDIAADAGKQNAQPPITVNAKLDRDDINTQIKNFKTNSKIKVGVKLDFASHKDDAGNEIQKGISKQIKDYNGKTKIKVGVELDKDSINQEVQNTQVGMPIRLGVELDRNSINQEVQNIQATAPIRLGVELDPAGVQNVNNQLDNIRQQIQQLGNITINFGGNPRNRGIGNVTSAFERATREVYNLYKQIESMELKLGKLEMSGIDAGNITTYRHQLDGLRQTYENLLATMSGQNGAINLDVVFTDIDRARTLITELSSSVDNARTKLAKDIKIDINNGKLQGEIDSVIQKFNQLGVANQGVTDGVEELQRMLTNMRVSDNIESVTSDYQEFLQLLKTVKNAVNDLEREINEANRPELLDATREAAMQRLNGLFEEGSQAARIFGERAEQLRNELNMAGSTKGIELVNKKIKNLGTEIKNSGLQVKTFSSRLKEQFSKYGQYISAASVFMYVEQGLRSMFEQVKLIDSAMTELKKVTDETDASYNQFLSNAATRAKEIGTTIDGLVSSTADFARLGYDFADAQGLAEVANIYAVVGDEIEGVEDATQSLISTLAAFKSEIGDMSNDEFALSIVDKMNEVANNYAISSGGLGEALQRSASSMAAANNSLDETIAMITAANEVAQNPEKVGKWLCRLKKWLYRLNS